MDIGMAGRLILFFSVLVAEVLLGIFVLGYAGYSFITVVSNTAAGNDEVIWPGDPMQEWFLKGFYLIWVAGVWTVPAVFLMKALGLTADTFEFYLAVAGVTAFFFPISMLSAMGSLSALAILRPAIIVQLLKKAPAMFVFYVMSGGLLALCVFLFYRAAFVNAAWVVPAAVIGAASFLIYARLLGRIALLANRSAPELPDQEEPEEKPVTSRKPKRKKKSRAVTDPWAIPDDPPPAPESEEPEDPLGPSRGTYAFAEEESRADGPAAEETTDEAPAESYALAPVQESNRPKIAFETPEVSKREEELNTRREPPPIPAHPLVTGIYGFPLYNASLGAFFKLALGVTGMTLLLRGLILLSPFSHG
jgi:hypothetical protein